MSKTAKFLVRTARDRLGLEIRRAPRATANRIRPAAPGRIVEFVGLPGVGKSYLMRHCLKAMGATYMAQDEVRLAVNAPDFRVIADLDVRDFYKKLMERSLSQLREDLSQATDLQTENDRMLFRGSFQKSNMLIDAAYPIRVLTDEGVVKRFRPFLLKLAEAGNPGARIVLRRRHIVLLEADPELTLSQIRERLRHDSQARTYRDWSDEDILQHSAQEGPRYREIIEALRPWTAGVLRLSRSDSTRHNVEAVSAFVHAADTESS